MCDAMVHVMEQNFLACPKCFGVWVMAGVAMAHMSCNGAYCNAGALCMPSMLCVTRGVGDGGCGPEPRGLPEPLCSLLLLALSPK